MAKTPEIKCPTEAEVPALTDRLAEIETEMKALKVEKEGIQARLELYALNQKGEHLGDERREGRKVTLVGKRFSLPVVFTSDLLIKSFKAESPKHQELRGILLGAPISPGTSPESIAEAKDLKAKADEQLKLFFDPPNTWEVKQEDGQKFRAAAAEWLPEDIAPKFVAACTSKDKHGVAKSNTVFDFKALKEVSDV